MADDNGNGEIKLAEHGILIEQTSEDVKEIKDTLNKFIEATTTKRLECAGQFGVLNTNAKLLWGIMFILLAAVVGLIAL